MFIFYGVKDGPNLGYKWYGNLDFLETEEVWLPALNYVGSKKYQEFWVRLGDPNNMEDDNPSNNSLKSVMELPKILPNEFILQIKTNNLGRSAENAYSIINDLGTVFYSKDNFADSTEYNIPVKLDDGCYQFRFTDTKEDGISIHWWYRNSNPELVGINGGVAILSNDGEELHSFKSDFGQELLLNFLVE